MPQSPPQPGPARPALRRQSVWRGLSLRVRLAVAVLSVVLLTAGTLTGLSFLHLRSLELARAGDRLASETDLQVEAIQAVFQRIDSDAAILARMPPVVGLMRADGTGTDPLDGSSAEQWRNRLADIFAAFLTMRPEYTQVRFIGRDDDWREVVRVDRRPGGTLRVADADLQQKGAEPYLAPSQHLADGIAYFSAVTLNRDHGQTDETPTIRLVRPLLLPDGTIFGVIVINADYPALLRLAAPPVRAGFTVTAISDAQDYMVYTSSGAPVFRLHGTPDWTAPPAARRIAEGATDRMVREGGDVALMRQVFAAGPDRPFGLYVETLAPADLLLTSSWQGLRRAAGVAVALGLAALALALFIGAQIKRPVRAITAAMRARHLGDAAVSDLPDVGGEIGELAAAMRPLDDALVRETARSRAILAGVADGIVTIAEGGVIEETNPAFDRLFGYAPGALVGQRIEVLMPPDIGAIHQGAVDGASTDTAPRAMAGNRDICGRRQDGGLVPLEISISRARYSGASHFIGVVRDISARKAWEDRTAALIAALEKSNTELDTFAYVASHDLRAPLRVIDNAASWLAEDLEPHLTDDTRESLDLLRSRVSRMDRLLDDLLRHSRIGRVSEPSPVVTGAELAEDLRGLVVHRDGITVEVTDGFASITAPRTPLLTVLLNLVSNAVKHHDRDEGRVVVDAELRGGAIEITVDDDGPGIPPKFHAKVFEMFQTLKPRDDVDGSGMGLAMVRKYVDVVGGAIRIDPAEGRGTRFHLTWPLDGQGTHDESAAA